MTNNIKSNNNRKSLCEESLLVFVNILKLSSVALARRTLSSNSSDHDDQTPFGRTKFDDHDDQSTPPLSHVTRPKRSCKKRSQKPQPPPEFKLSYVMLPDVEDDVAAAVMNNDHHDEGDHDGQFSDYIRRFHQKTENDLKNSIVEGKAADYIKRFHEKNKNDLNNESMRRLHYNVLPPPVPKVFNKK